MVWNLRMRAFQSPSGARLEIVTPPSETGGSHSVYERLMKPHSGRADAHVHLAFEQTYEVLSGRGRCRVGKEERVVSAGESVTMPRDVPHVDLWNDSDADLHWRMTVTPAELPFVDVYAATLGERMTSGRLNRQQDLTRLDIFAILGESGGKSYDARLPRRLQDPAIPLLARLARALGRGAVRERF